MVELISIKEEFQKFSAIVNCKKHFWNPPYETNQMPLYAWCNNYIRKYK